MNIKVGSDKYGVFKGIKKSFSGKREKLKRVRQIEKGLIQVTC